MAVPAWFWPANGTFPKGTVGSALLSSGIVFADWRANQVYPFNGTTFAPQASGVAEAWGLCGITPAGGNAYAQSFVGQLSLYNGTSTLSGAAMPTGTYTGCCYATANASGYAVTQAGKLYSFFGAAVGSGLTQGPCWGLAAGSSSLFTLQAAQNQIGTFALSNGATGTVALPSTAIFPTCLAASGTVLACAGSQPITLVSGAAQTGFAVNPANTALLMGVNNGTATVWISGGVNTFAYSTKLTGIGAATALAWTPVGTQALVCNATSVLVLGYSAGALTLSQTLSVSGGSAVVIMADSSDALVCQPAAGQVTKLQAVGGVWSVTGTVTGLAGCSSAGVINAFEAVIGYNGNLVFPTLNSGVWSFTGAGVNTVALGINPTYLTVDSTFANLVFAAQGSNGNFVAVSGAAVVQTATGTGTAGAIMSYRDQVFIADPTNNLLRVYGLDSGTVWNQRSTVAIPSGFTGLGLDGQTYFASGSAATQLYNFGAPYILWTVPMGWVGFYSGGSWTAQAALPVGQVPSAITLDVSGNAHVATVQNGLYTVSSGGTVTAGIVTQVSGQPQNVPLGVSSLCVSGAAIYAGTSLSGVVVQVQ